MSTVPGLLRRSWYRKWCGPTTTIEYWTLKKGYADEDCCNIVDCGSDIVRIGRCDRRVERFRTAVLRHLLRTATVQGFGVSAAGAAAAVPRFGLLRITLNEARSARSNADRTDVASMAVFVETDR